MRKYYHLNNWMLLIAIEDEQDIESTLNEKETKLSGVRYIFIQDRAPYEKKVFPTKLLMSSIKLRQIGHIFHDGEQWIGNIALANSTHSFGPKNYRVINRISEKYEPNAASYIHFVVYIVMKGSGMSAPIYHVNHHSSSFVYRAY